MPSAGRRSFFMSNKAYKLIDYNASTNTPELTQGVGTQGWRYHVTHAGSQMGMDLGVGDVLVFISGAYRHLHAGPVVDAGTYS